MPLTGDTGYFWFFDPANVELIIKVLDGRALNSHFWVFYGALSNVEYTLTVTDTQTGAVRRYLNPAVQLASVGDTTAFAAPAPTPLAGVSGARGGRTPPPHAIAEAAAGACCRPPAPLPQRRPLRRRGGWRTSQGKTGPARPCRSPATRATSGSSTPTNVELVIKVLDGRRVNGKFWVFYGALSNVEYTITVTDTETGAAADVLQPERKRFGPAWRTRRRSRGEGRRARRDTDLHGRTRTYGRVLGVLGVLEVLFLAGEASGLVGVAHRLFAGDTPFLTRSASEASSRHMPWDAAGLEDRADLEGLVLADQVAHRLVGDQDLQRRRRARCRRRGRPGAARPRRAATRRPWCGSGPAATAGRRRGCG